MAKVRDWQALTTDEGKDVETFERIPRQSVRRWDDEVEN
jgi:hypothetical protein